MIFFHHYVNSGLIIDLVQDIVKINSIAIHAPKSGQIIIGGGVVKHHVCNANLMRNGADFSVYINTAQEFDGSDAGARPEEAISWGKIRINAHPVKVYAEATLVFPLIVAQTFVRYVEKGLTLHFIVCQMKQKNILTGNSKKNAPTTLWTFIRIALFCCSILQ